MSDYNNIINLPQETEVEFLSRIISLINCYKWGCYEQREVASYLGRSIGNWY